MVGGRISPKTAAIGALGWLQIAHGFVKKISCRLELQPE